MYYIPVCIWSENIKSTCTSIFKQVDKQALGELFWPVSHGVQINNNFNIQSMCIVFIMPCQKSQHNCQILLKRAEPGIT